MQSAVCIMNRVTSAGAVRGKAAVSEQAVGSFSRQRIDLFSEMHAISGECHGRDVRAAGRRISGQVLSHGLSGESGGSAAEISMNL